VIVGVGVDVCPVERWTALAARRPGLVRRLLTEAEAAVPPESQAARFAAKEALAKALGGPSARWHDAEVATDASGKPYFILRGSAAAAAERLGVARTHLSISHDAGLAVAFVVCETAS
jgi:holo-[acyl-carrier protein] synthase